MTQPMHDPVWLGGPRPSTECYHDMTCRCLGIVHQSSAQPPTGGRSVTADGRWVYGCPVRRARMHHRGAFILLYITNTCRFLRLPLPAFGWFLWLFGVSGFLCRKCLKRRAHSSDRYPPDPGCFPGLALMARVMWVVPAPVADFGTSVTEWTRTATDRASSARNPRFSSPGRTRWWPPTSRPQRLDFPPTDRVRSQEADAVFIAVGTLAARRCHADLACARRGGASRRPGAP